MMKTLNGRNDNADTGKKTQAKRSYAKKRREGETGQNAVDEVITSMLFVINSFC